jgi:hypothetical protein
MIIIYISLLILLSVYLYSCYTGVIKARNQMDEALSGIDVQLKKRTDLIPNVLKIAQKFMKHEKEIFTLSYSFKALSFFPLKQLSVLATIFPVSILHISLENI